MKAAAAAGSAVSLVPKLGCLEGAVAPIFFFCAAAAVWGGTPAELFPSRVSYREKTRLSSFTYFEFMSIRVRVV